MILIVLCARQYNASAQIPYIIKQILELCKPLPAFFPLFFMLFSRFTALRRAAFGRFLPLACFSCFPPQATALSHSSNCVCSDDASTRFFTLALHMCPSRCRALPPSAASEGNHRSIRFLQAQAFFPAQYHPKITVGPGSGNLPLAVSIRKINQQSIPEIPIAVHIFDHRREGSRIRVWEFMVSG